MFEVAGDVDGQHMQLLGFGCWTSECLLRMYSCQCLNIFLTACEKYGIKVARVPTYSPTSVAEHALALLFALNRYV
jgi:hypothetical protein